MIGFVRLVISKNFTPFFHMSIIVKCMMEMGTEYPRIFCMGGAEYTRYNISLYIWEYNISGGTKYPVTLGYRGYTLNVQL